MSEVIQTEALQPSVLRDTHQKLGALIAIQEGHAVPTSYGDVLLEYAAVRERGAGLTDLSHHGRLLVGGSEAVQFLNGLITNDMKTLAENQWMPALFPNVQGRLIASVRVIHRPDGFLLETEAATHKRVLQTISRFTLAGDFKVTDLTTELVHLSLQGQQATEIINGLFGESAARLDRFGVVFVPWRESQVTILRSTEASIAAFDLYVAAAHALALWETLTAAGARPVGTDALEILRIENGRPRFGVDMDESNVVSETNLDEAISFTKGCYIGQEIVARIKYRGHVAKKLTGLRFERGVRVESGASVLSVEGKDIGRLTSATFSPHLGCAVALGYLKYDYLTPGTSVKVVAADQELPAQVAALPFVSDQE